MSADTVKQIIGRAVAEPDYRELLLADPAKAFEGYALTEGETATLKNLTAREFDTLGGELETRVSRAGLNIGQSGEAGGDTGVRVHNPLGVVKTTGG